MRVTLKDIAMEADVSLMTVSNVVNGRHERVSQATVERIEKIIATRGYVPNASARSLAANASKMIGLLAPSLEEDTLLLSPHNIAVFGVMERQLRHKGFHVLFRGVSDIDEAAVSMRSWALDGAVLMGFRDEEISELDPPPRTKVVALDSYVDHPQVTALRSDDFEGGRLAAQHLIDLGHREIAFAAPQFTSIGPVAARFAGFRAAHEASGLSVDAAHVLTVATQWDAGRSAGRELGRTHPQITAVFATADISAAGFVEGVRQAGRTVPGEVSVIGFDDIELASYITPKLTTIAQGVMAKGSLVAQTLLAQIGGETRLPADRVLPVHLIERESTAPAPT